MGLLEEAGVYFSIASVFVTIFLTYLVIRFDKSRRKREEEFYESQAKTGIHEILKHFVEVDRISKNELTDTDEVEELDEPHILLNLNRYYKQNRRKMDMLLENTTLALSRWTSLKSTNRTKYNQIIEDFEWLTKEYFSIEKPDDIQYRMWHNQYKDVTRKRYEIDETLEILLK